MKAAFITIIKKSQFTAILVREDKKVWFNFGDDNWFEFEKMGNIKGINKTKKYKAYLESNKFKKNWKETMETIRNNSYENIINKFIKNFKSDRGNRILRNDVEIDPNKSINNIEYEFKK